ncbi:subunit of dna polymerase ii [Stemphylium lycopersici]|nr:subunit of dna polymerase ii [Stemphylium lycopersici]
MYSPAAADIDSHDAGTGQLPLAGAILCCTSIAPEQRTQLAAIGAQMGATIKLDLTSDVTHLIVGSTDSAKYRYVAKSRDDVKVLSPEWLGALREVWMSGDDDLDMAALEKEYRMPTFSGLRICLTGFDDPEQRRSIQETVDSNGAEYHGDLTKSVTHLIAATPSGKKYEHALNWRMKIVSLEWLEQSLERGMALDETLYNPTMPLEERGQGAWDRRQPMSPAIGKRTRDAEPSQALNPFRRKLRRSASTKLGSQSDALWAGITAPSFEQKLEEDEWTEDVLAKQDSTRASTRTQTPVSPCRDASALQHDALTEPHPVDPADAHQPSLLPQLDEASQHHGIFEGRITTILRQHLESNGARVIRAVDLNNFSLDELRRGYFVIPHDAEADLTALPEHAGSSISLVTNWWVERCLYGKRLVDPAEDVLSRPFERLSISGFSGLTINSTGFSGIELLHVTKVITLMGASYDEQLSAKTSVVICNPPTVNSPKLKFATDKRIPAVDVKWLWECLRSGRLQSYAEYQLNKTAQPQKPKQRAQRQVHEPTAPLSDGSAKAHEQSQAPKIVTKQSRQQLPQRPGVLDLAQSADGSSTATTDPSARTNDNTNNLNLDDDESAISGFDGAASFPLQETSANSPRRPSTSSETPKPFSRARSSSAESLIAPVPRKSKHDRDTATTDTLNPEPALDAVIPAGAEPEVPQEPPKEKEPEEEKDYSSILAQLRANRKTAPSPADGQAASKTRKRRQLGRATSTRSNASAGGDSSGNLLANDDDDEENTVLVDEYQPSQELGWDSPGAAKAREQMIRKLGGTVQEKSVAVEGIGVVRDVGGDGPTGRAGRKRRG